MVVPKGRLSVNIVAKSLLEVLGSVSLLLKSTFKLSIWEYVKPVMSVGKLSFQTLFSTNTRSMFIGKKEHIPAKLVVIDNFEYRSISNI